AQQRNHQRYRKVEKPHEGIDAAIKAFQALLAAVKQRLRRIVVPTAHLIDIQQGMETHLLGLRQRLQKAAVERVKTHDEYVLHGNSPCLPQVAQLSLKPGACMTVAQVVSSRSLIYQ